MTAGVGLASGLFRVNLVSAPRSYALLQAESCLELTYDALVNLHRHWGFSKGRACFIQLFAIKK